MEQLAVDIPYFYGDISREDAEVILWDRDCIEGMYLLRSSQNKDAKYVLSLCSDKRVHHYRIKQNVDGLLFVHGVQTTQYANLPLLVSSIEGLVCKPTIACNKALNKIKPGHYYRLSSDELQRAIENKAKEWGIDGAMLQTAQKQGLQSVVINTLHESQQWFHGKISRARAEERLLVDGHEDGKFLIRERDDCCSYALCFSHEGEMKHYKIDVISTGEMRIKDGPRFENLLELISHYSVLNDGLWCTLKEPCPRSRFVSSATSMCANETNNDVHHRAPANHQQQQKPLLEPARDVSLRPRLEPPNECVPNSPQAESPVDTNKVIPKKTKPSYVKVLPDLNMLKMLKASQSSRSGSVSSPVSSPSLSPTSPLSVTSPTALKSPTNVTSQPNFILNLSNGMVDVNSSSDSANNNEQKDDSVASEKASAVKKVKRRAPVPLPRRDVPICKAQEEASKNQETPVPKPRRDIAAKVQESVNPPIPSQPQILNGPGVGMLSVIKQLRQQLSATENEKANVDADINEESASVEPPLPDETIESCAQESTEPIYQEIDPDYDSTTGKDGNAPADEGYDREGRLRCSAGVSKNCLFLPQLHENVGIGRVAHRNRSARKSTAPKPSLFRIPFLKKRSLSSPAFNINRTELGDAPKPPIRKESLLTKTQQCSQPSLRHESFSIRQRVDEEREQAEGTRNNDSLQVALVTNGHKNLTGLCRKPTWTREESEKHFRTVQRFRKNPMTINSNNIILQEKMGTGNFGDVYKAHFKSDRVEVPFAVKMLKSTVPSAKADILQEAKIMTGLDHPNIVRLIGICELESFMLVMEMAPLGPLNMYLKNNSSTVPAADVIQLLYQIACGMEYLEKEMFVHRDLAARNVLLVNENFAKISDFGMSRVVGLDKDYYQMKNLEGKLPLKWYAPECIQYCKFSSKTDVWSYGIAMWEAMSYGEKPYMGLAGPELWKMLMDGRRLEQPRNCPDYVYNIMLRCWKFSADERPTFKELTTLLQDCVELSSSEISYR